MEPVVIMKFIAEFGLPLFDRLMEAQRNREVITPAKWAELRKLAAYTPEEALAKAEATRTP